jgi:hypothetical protein
MKRTIWLVVVLALLWFIGIRGWLHVNYRDQNVVAGQQFSPLFLLNPHYDAPQFLKVRGHTYRNVRGLPPCYLPIPELDSILFVTQAYHQDILFHIFNLKTDKELEINGKYGTFGGHIGSRQTNGAPYTEFIESADSHFVVAVSIYPDARKSYYLNLPSRKLDKIVYEKLDSNGKVSKRLVYVDGDLVTH